MQEIQTPWAAEALALAQQLFEQSLPRTPEALAYLHPRPGSDIPAGGLGYAPAGYSGWLQSRGVPTDALTATGLLDAKGEELFSERITFPWISMSGRRITGLGGRKFQTMDLRPKYVNSPESPWFAKGRSVYGLAQAAGAIHAQGWAIVVEGPFDLLSLWEKGWYNAVATVGAKVSLDQLLLVLRLTDDVVVLLDNDEGGRRGVSALQGALGSHLVPSSAQVRVATLRDGNDPGDASREALDGALMQALPIMHKQST